MISQGPIDDVASEPQRLPEKRIALPRLLNREPGACPDCGHPMPPYGPDAPLGMTRDQLRKAGKTACLCENCGMPLRRWKRVTPDTPRCSRCGRHVPGASPEAVSVPCCLCVAVSADMHAAGMLGPKPDERACPDCGGPLPKRRRYCDRCTDKRRRQAYRRLRDARRRAAPQLTAICLS